MFSLKVFYFFLITLSESIVLPPFFFSFPLDFFSYEAITPESRIGKELEILIVNPNIVKRILLWCLFEDFGLDE